MAIPIYTVLPYCVIELHFFMKKKMKKMKMKNLGNHVFLYFILHVVFSSNLCMHLLFYMFSTLMSLEDRLRLKLKTEISLHMAIMLEHPWQSLYTQYYHTVAL